MSVMANESLYEIKTVSEPVVHQDQVFFVETLVDEEENNYQKTIYCVNQKTGEKVHWGDGGQSNTSLALSPNAKWLSYLSTNTDNNKPQLFIIPRSGGSAVQLTEEEQGVSTYKWTQNSAGIYYQTTQEVEKATEEEAKQQRKLPQKTVITKVKYKLDKAGILSTNQLYQLKKVTIATQATELIMERSEAFSFQYVAQDESYVLFGDRLHPDDEWASGTTVYKYHLATKDVHALTRDIPEGNFYFVGANETEETYLLVGNDFQYKFVTLDQLYAYDVATGKLTCLTDDLDKNVGDVLIGDTAQNVQGFPVEWLDNETFLFPVTDQGKIVLYKGSFDGQLEVFVDECQHLMDGTLSACRSQLVAVRSTFTEPSELGLIDLSTGEWTAIYNPNESFSQTYQVMEPERFWYESTDGEAKIQGWYVPPVQVNNQHPVVLYVHGGPQVAYGETFFHEMHVLSAQGYGVLMINPRGSNGYGQAFVAAILGDYGNKDYDDLLLGLDTILEQHPEIDKGELYVAGGSYGGFMTNWIVGHTDRFKRAVTQRCISNWVSFYGASDIGPFFNEYQLGADLSDVTALWNMSPLKYAHQVKTPLLILHGEEDLRCPLSQAQEMYIAMKKYRNETKLITYPQSSHGLSREGLPNLRMERLTDIQDWFKAAE